LNEIRIPAATSLDIPRLTEIYNHNVLNTPVTLDLVAHLPENCTAWCRQFGTTGRHRLLAAEENGVVLAYAGTAKFRQKAAYDTTVETTIYCGPDALGRGIGSRLYAALFQTISREDIHCIVAGYTLPSPASVHVACAFWI
jgi:phosphinothricin acetyltransferase